MRESKLDRVLVAWPLILFLYCLFSNAALAMPRPQPPDDYDGPSFIDDIPPWLFLTICAAVTGLFIWGKEKGEDFDVQGCGCLLMIILFVVGMIFTFLKSCS
jgi:quinol-cytochrome oxidoreductase complex cytochrome b subunit